MSYHKIEDIVEDSIVLTDQMYWPENEKRSVLYNLFQFQQQFDCGYTHFRQIAILLRYEFTYRLPLSAHPDYEGNPAYFKEYQEHWLPTDLSDEDAERVYVDDTDKHMYVDAGSAFWERLNTAGQYGTPPAPMQTEELVYTMLEAALLRKNHNLFARWYALLCEDILEEQLLSLQLAEWFTDETLCAIRQMGITKNINQLFQQQKKEQAYFDFPKLSYYSKNDDKLLGFKGRFFLDTDTDLAKIEAQYHRFVKAILAKEAAKAKAPEKFQIIKEALDEYALTNHWTYGGYLEDNTRRSYLWYKDLDGEPTAPSASYKRQFMLLVVDSEEETIRPLFAIQLGLILQWQKQQAALHPRHFHAYSDIIPFVSEKQAASSHFNAFGLLKFPLQNSASKLKQKIDYLKACLQTAGERYFAMIDAQFPTAYFALGVDRVLDIMENGIDHTGVIPEHIFIGSTISAKQLFAFWEAEQGNSDLLRDLFPEEEAPVMPNLRTHFSLMPSKTESSFLIE